MAERPEQDAVAFGLADEGVAGAVADRIGFGLDDMRTEPVGPSGSSPYDAKGLLISAIESPDPIIFLEPKRLYNGPFDGHHDRPVTAWSKHELGETPEGHYTIPLGKAAVRREGQAVTVITYGSMVYTALAAAGGDRRRRRRRSRSCAPGCRSIWKPSSLRSPRPAAA